MKKLMALLLLALLICVAAAAEEATPTPAPTPVPDIIAQPDMTRRPMATATPRPADAPLPEDPFLGNAVEIARRLGQLADSSVFFDYCNRSGASAERWEAVTRGDHTMPARIFTLSGEELVRGLSGGDPASAPWLDLSRVELRRDLVNTIPEMMFIGMDNDDVNLIQSLGRYKVFAADRAEGCGVMVMLYEDGVPIVLVWYTDRGAVNIAAFFMPDETLEACGSAQDVSAWFASLRMPVVAFEEVQW